MRSQLRHRRPRRRGASPAHTRVGRDDARVVGGGEGLCKVAFEQGLDDVFDDWRAPTDGRRCERDGGISRRARKRREREAGRLTLLLAGLAFLGRRVSDDPADAHEVLAVAG